MWMFRVGSALVCFTSTETGSVQAPASLYTSWSNEASIDTEVQMEIVCHFQRDRGISTKSTVTFLRTQPAGKYFSKKYPFFVKLILLCYMMMILYPYISSDKTFPQMKKYYCKPPNNQRLCYRIPRKLHLFDLADRYVDPQTYLQHHKMAFVTAADKHYFESVKVAIISIQTHFPKSDIIFYDLGLVEAQAKEMKRFCNVQYHKFPFEQYPPSVRLLKQYRWKPIVVAEPNKESHISVRLPSDPGHGILAFTDPRVYEFIPTDTEMHHKKGSRMKQAGFMLIFRTKKVVEDLLVWWVACALETNCMDPTERTAICHLDRSLRWSKDFHGCHRYDQSVINILLANLMGYNSSCWSTNLSFYEIKRRASSKKKPLTCDWFFQW